MKVLPTALVKLFWLTSLVSPSISLPSAHASNTRIEKHNHTAGEIVCLSTSGNGYNWSATFTWAAEILRDAVAKAPDNAQFNVACVSGASSGSVFVATYGSLLQNKQLFERANFNPQSITKKEAQILYQSLLYMALAADFRPEVVNFYTSRDSETDVTTPWWKSQFSLERVMLDFGTRVMLAQHISQADIKQVEQLEQFVRYQTLDELAAAVGDRQVLQAYRQVTNEIWQGSQAILNKLYQDANYPRTAKQLDRDDFRENPQHPVRQALARKPADGILALNYSELAFTKSTVDYKRMRPQAPPVETLVPFVFANQATAERIISSSFYQQQVKLEDPYVEQYVICVVPDYYTMIQHGVREPDLLPVGIYRLSPLLEGATKDLAAGVSYFYQPLAEQIWEAEPQFELIPSNRIWYRGTQFLQARMGVAGGWIDSYVGGQATLFLGSSYADRLYSSHLYFSTFSFEDGVAKFARNVVNKYFAPNNFAAAIEDIEQQRDRLPLLIKRYQRYRQNQTIAWQPIFVDWSLRIFPENQNLWEKIISAVDRVLELGFSHLPVATTKQSNYLLARTMNVVRHTLGTNEDLGYIYDRSYEDSVYGKENITKF